MDGFLSHIGEMRDTTRLAANLGPASRNRAGRHARQTMHTAGIPHPIPQNHWNSANPTNRRRHRTSSSVGRQRKNTRNPLASHTMSHRTCSIAPHHITPTPIRAPHLHNSTFLEDGAHMHVPPFAYQTIDATMVAHAPLYRYESVPAVRLSPYCEGRLAGTEHA